MKEKKEVKKENVKLKPKNPKRIIISGIALFLLITLLVLVKLHLTDSIDSLVESFVIGIRSDNLTKVMITITNISRAYSLIVISIILLFIIKKKKTPLFIIINLTCVFLTSQLFKIIIRRPRPDGEFLIGASGYSFPSGHAMVSMAYFTFILYLINKNIKKKSLKLLINILTIILILSIGLSRVYLGVHYITDILGGYLMSCIYLMIFLTIYDGLNKEGAKK